MTQEQNSLQSELEELKEKFDVLDDKLILEFEFRKMRKRRFEVTGFENLPDFDLKLEIIKLFHSGKLSLKHKYLTISEIEKAFQVLNNQHVDTKTYEESINVSPQSIEDKISIIKEKWKPIHDFDAHRNEPQLYEEEEKRSNAVIHSGTMHKDGKRISSFLRVKI